MYDFYLIGDDRVKESLDMLSVIKGVENAYILKSQGKATLFPVVTHVWCTGSKDMDIKSGYIGGDVNIYGLKALTYIEDNDKLGLPRLNGTMMVFDSNTGQLKGVIDSRSVTGIRTGAAGAIGSKYLARKDSETLMLIGAGNQAFYNLAGNILVMENLKKVTIYDPENMQNAYKFAESFKERMKEEILKKYENESNFASLCSRLDLKLEAVEHPEMATREADIIVTVTPSRNPLLKKKWIKEGTHLNCIGADMEGKQETDENIFADARIIVDDITQAFSIGKTEIPFKKGIITKDSIVGEIGDIINGITLGRISKNDITIFDTTGLALQDLITAEILIKQAETDNLPKVQF